MIHSNFVKPGSATIDLLPIRELKASGSETVGRVPKSTSLGLKEPFIQRYFEKLVSADSSSQLEEIDRSMITTGNLPDTLGIFVFDMVRPEDHVDVMFEREKSAFTRLLPTLMQRYERQFVAVHDGVVVDSDRSSSELVRRFFRRFGDTHVYIGYVGQEEPVSYSVSPFNF